MKNFLILIFSFIVCGLTAQITTCTNTPCYPFNNTDQFQIYQAIRNAQGATTVAINCNTCVTTVKQSTVAGDSFTITPSGTGTIQVRQAALETFTMTQLAGSNFTVRPAAGISNTCLTTGGAKLATEGEQMNQSNLLTDAVNSLANLDLYASASYYDNNLFSIDQFSNASLTLAISAYDAWIGANPTLRVIFQNIVLDGATWRIVIGYK